MTFNTDIGYIVAVAAGLAALIYIGRQVGRMAKLASVLVKLPAEHEQLLLATKANTVSISGLTEQVRLLTIDVATLARQGGRIP